MSKPREMTEEEVRERFLRHVASLVDYWESETRAESLRARLEGLAFSMLVAIDGGAAGLPGFILAPSPHKDDKEFNRSRGANWYPRAKCEHDIAGSLHEEFSRFRRGAVQST